MHRSRREYEETRLSRVLELATAGAVSVPYLVCVRPRIRASPVDQSVHEGLPQQAAATQVRVFFIRSSLLAFFEYFVSYQIYRDAATCLGFRCL